MKGEKLEKAREAVINFARLLGPGDTLSLVSFSGDAKEDFTNLSSTDQARIASIVRQLDLAWSGTNLHGAMGRAYQLARKGRSQSSRLIVLTDGQANVGPNDLGSFQAQVEPARKEGITTSCYGVGSDYDGQFLAGIAKAGGGNHRFIDNPAQVTSYFQQEL